MCGVEKFLPKVISESTAGKCFSEKSLKFSKTAPSAPFSGASRPKILAECVVLWVKKADFVLLGPLGQGVFNHFPTPRPLSGGIELQGFGQNLASEGEGVRVASFRTRSARKWRRRRRFRKFSRFFGKLFLKTAIKSEFWGVLGVKFSKIFEIFKLFKKQSMWCFMGDYIKIHQNPSI